MEKRKARRVKRRLQVRFWSLENPVVKKGFTYDISLSGMFVCTSSPFKTGTRIAVEVEDAGKVTQFQAIVRHSIRVAPEMRQVHRSGMGVQLIPVAQLMAEVLSSDASKKAEVPNETAPEAEEVSVYQVAYSTPNEVINSFQRDLRHGGVFIPTTQLADTGQEVTIEFKLPWLMADSIQVRAKVVNRYAPDGDALDGKKLVGIGVEFCDPAAAVEEFAAVLKKIEQQGPGAEAASNGTAATIIN
jgi:Tfp pilus assembly protein PilZ